MLSGLKGRPRPVGMCLHEIVEIKKLIVGLESDKEKSNRAWDDLMSVSDQISEKWTEVSAINEIKSQREKAW